MSAAVELAAAALLARRGGTPADLAGLALSPAEAAEVQARVLAALGEVAGGWKVALVSGEPVSAPLCASTILPSGHAFAPAGSVPFKIETELGFRLGRDLPPRERPYALQELLEAVVSVHAAFEVVLPRAGEPPATPFALFLADNLGNAFTVLGPGQSCGALPERGALWLDGEAAASGTHPQGDPLAPLLALACSRREGMPDRLLAGQTIITGSFTGALPVDSSGLFSGVFDGLEPVTARFTA